MICFFATTRIEELCQLGMEGHDAQGTLVMLSKPGYEVR